MAEPGATWTWAGVLRRKSRAVSSLKMPESFAVTQEHAMHDSNTKVVVITGASAGVGRATAVAFARTGARVALLARGIEGLRGAAQEVENAGGKALIIPTDVADPRDRKSTRLNSSHVAISDAVVCLKKKKNGKETTKKK